MISIGQHLQVTVGMSVLDQQVSSVWNYRVTSAPIGLVRAVDFAEAYWNHVKDQWRALAVTGDSFRFFTITVKDAQDPEGDYATYPIIPGESRGTRGLPEAGPQALASFVACGVRLSVGTRATRPGQKRIPFLCEADVIGQSIVNGFILLVDDLMNIAASAGTLGAPAATVTIQPEIYVPANEEAGTAARAQDVTGHVVNPYVTTQNSRKLGRGV